MWKKDSNSESCFVKKMSINKTYKTTYVLVVLFSCYEYLSLSSVDEKS